jgi:hypothetical protein
VVHLVKDPRAYVHSMDKTYTIRKSNSTDATKNAVRLAYRWAAANFSILVLHHLRFQKTSRFFIRYDELAADYLAAMRKICDWIDVPFDADRAMRFRENRDHAIGGNPMRAESRPVQLDNEWLRRLHPARSRFVWLITWPLARFFGFRSSGQLNTDV